MTKEQAINEAIKRIQGQPMLAGTIVAHSSYPLTMELLRYEGTNAICNDGKEEKSFPRNEIFDVKKAINVGNHLLNIGFWTEGMESIVLQTT